MTSAEATIKSASKDLSANEYSWACFKAHQAAESLGNGNSGGIFFRR
ncbi:MAG: HEPN domain-containing protein [Candidatus Caldarchaeum sp.]|nr:HEPN domain-containing protein [Candidatus Caldarchaeum sp.]